MNEARVIRKYVNRRLYDTQESRYVNLEELRRLILEGEQIRVVERTSGADITTSILLQIIGESQRENPLLSAKFLCDVIRLTGRGQTDPSLAGRLNDALQSALREPPPAPSGGYFNS